MKKALNLSEKAFYNYRYKEGLMRCVVGWSCDIVKVHTATLTTPKWGNN